MNSFLLVDVTHGEWPYPSTRLTTVNPSMATMEATSIADRTLTFNKSDCKTVLNLPEVIEHGFTWPYKYWMDVSGRYTVLEKKPKKSNLLFL